MSERLVKAMAALQAANTEYYAALLETLKQAPAVASARPATTVKPSSTVVRPTSVRQATAEARVPLPKSPLPAPNKLSDETRAASMPKAVELAVQILKLGTPELHVRSALFGQIAIHHLPSDEDLINDALREARASLGM